MRNVSRGAIGVIRPHSFMIPWECGRSLILGYHALKDKYDIDLITAQGAYVDENRNDVLQAAQRQKLDWLLFIDTDIVFTKEDVLKIVKNYKEGDADLITGVYYLADGTKPVVYKFTGEDRPYQEMDRFTKDEIIDIDACGMGFCLLGRKAIHGMGARPFDRMYYEGKYFGEDIAYCHRAREKGIKMQCDTSIKLGHLRFKEIL